LSNRYRFKDKSENHDQAKLIDESIESNDFEVFYPSLPMKDFSSQLNQRQSIPKSELAKTTWFNERIAEILQ